MQNLGGQTKSIMVFFEQAYDSELPKTSPRTKYFSSISCADIA